MLLLAISMIACSKNDDETTVPAKKKYLTRIENSEDGSSTANIYTYQNGRFVSITFTYNGEKDTVVYDAAGRAVNRYNISDTGIALLDTYLYNSSGKLEKMLYTKAKFLHPEEDIYYIPTFDNSGKIKVLESFQVKNGVVNKGPVRQFTWNTDGNITELKVARYSNDTLQFNTITRYTYDNKPNYHNKNLDPAYCLFGFNYIHLSKNNLLSETYITLPEGKYDTYYTYYTYTYDSDGDIVTVLHETKTNEEPRKKITTRLYKYEYQ